MGYLAYKTSVQGRIIETIHTNTNSLSARLEAEAKNAGMALGYEKGRAEGVEKAATLMRGQLQGAPSTWTPTPPSALPPAPTDKPTEVEVVNNEKPVPVQITAGAINSITDAVKQSARPKLRKRRAK